MVVIFLGWKLSKNVTVLDKIHWNIFNKLMSKARAKSLIKKLEILLEFSINLFLYLNSKENASSLSGV